MKIKNYDYGPIGKRIREARLAKGMTQQMLAEKIDLGVQHISDIERGFSGMSLPTLIAILEVLDCDVDYILRGRASSNPNHPYNKTTKNMNTKQRMITEEILRILAEGFDAKTI